MLKLNYDASRALPGRTKTGQTGNPNNIPNTHTHSSKPSQWTDRLADQWWLHRGLVFVCVSRGGLEIPAGLSWDSPSRVNVTQRELWLTGPTLKHSTGWKGHLGWSQLGITRNTVFLFCVLGQKKPYIKMSTE